MNFKGNLTLAKSRSPSLSRIRMALTVYREGSWRDMNITFSPKGSCHHWQTRYLPLIPLGLQGDTEVPLYVPYPNLVRFRQFSLRMIKWCMNWIEGGGISTKDSKAASEKQFLWARHTESLIKVGHAVISKYYATVIFQITLPPWSPMHR